MRVVSYGKKLKFLSYIILFYVALSLLASLIAPLLFFTVKFFANTFDIALFNHFIIKGFSKFFARSRLIALIILLSPFLRKKKNFFLKDIPFKKVNANKIFVTLAIGSLSIYIMFLSLFGNNFCFEQKTKSLDNIFCLSTIIVAAAKIAILEETIFRGIFFKLFERNYSTTATVIFTSIIFAYCHIGHTLPNINQEDVTIFSGFRCLIQYHVNMFSDFNWTLFANLVMLGILLSLLLLKFKNIWYPILFHAGTVATIMFLSKFTTINCDYGKSLNEYILNSKVTLFNQCLYVLLLLKTFIISYISRLCTGLINIYKIFWK